jgi:predicted metalloprotease with PDZ domain
MDSVVIETTPAPSVTYRVNPVNPAAHLYEVTCRIEAPDPAGQVFAVPAWIPGSYLVRDYARHVIRVEAEVRGVPAVVRKIDKHTWRVAPSEGALLIRTLVHAADTSVRGAFLDARGGFFNGVCLFVRVAGQAHLPCDVHVDPPALPADAPHWRLVTTLERVTGTRYDFGAFRAASYEDLIDHPVLMGRFLHAEFDAAGVPHGLAVSGAPRADLDRVCRDLRRVCAWQAGLFGGQPPMARYQFLVRCLPGAYGGLEHRSSTALLARPEDLPVAGVADAGEGYRRFLGLASHEYFHLWLVRRIRPAVFVDADLGSEAYTRQLWLFEGVTSYYDDLALLRAGLVRPDAYLEMLGQALTRFYRTPGRRQQTLEDASFDAWIKFYRPDENSPNATVSYYLKGALVALALDLEIRLRSGGAHSLDDVMRALWNEYGADGSAGLPEGAFEQLAREVTGVDLDAFFQQALRTTVDPPVGVLLAQFGVRLHFRAAESASDAGGTRGRSEDRERPWLGLKLRADSGQARITYVQDGGPAQLAGLSPGDELVAIDGRRVTPDTYAACVARLVPEQPVLLHIFRDDEWLALEARPAPAPRDTCYLAFDPEADAGARARRDAWLASPAPAP